MEQILLQSLKRKGIGMKKIIFILFMAITTTGLVAQEVHSTSMTKKEKRQAEQEQQYQLNRQMLENRNFVLEADYLENKYGHRFLVNSTINFVAVDSATAVIQVGSDYRPGKNGVGGVTAKGSITHWALKEDTKHKTFYLTVNVMSSIGIFDVRFTIDSNGHTTALLTGMGPGRLTFDGNLVPHSQSSTYEGQSR